MTRTEAWEHAALRVLAQGSRKHPEQTLNALNDLLTDVRISAVVDIVEKIDPDTLSGMSGDASLVFMPMMLDGVLPVTFSGIGLEEALERLPVTALVMAAEDIDLDAEPEEGEAGEQAARADRAADLNAAAEAADQALEKAIMAARKAEEHLRSLEAGEEIPDDPSAIDAAKQMITNAKQTVAECLIRARDARRNAASAENAPD